MAARCNPCTNRLATGEEVFFENNTPSHCAIVRAEP